MLVLNEMISTSVYPTWNMRRYAKTRASPFAERFGLGAYGASVIIWQQEVVSCMNVGFHPTDCLSSHQ